MTNGGENRRVVRHRGKHHQSVPRPHPWPDAAVAQAVGRLHHRSNGTAPAVRPQPQHVLHAGPPASMCYTTNEVLVIIAVTCFLNFAFILLVMTCVHCFTDPSHHKK